MAWFSVVVGNVGTVYDGNDLAEAQRDYEAYCTASQRRQGRAAGEAVTLFANGEITAEYLPGEGEGGGEGERRSLLGALRIAVIEPDEALRDAFADKLGDTFPYTQIEVEQASPGQLVPLRIRAWDQQPERGHDREQGRGATAAERRLILATWYYSKAFHAYEALS